MTTPISDVLSKSAFVFHRLAHGLNFWCAGRTLPGWQGFGGSLPGVFAALLCVLLSLGTFPAQAASIGAPAPEVRGKVWLNTPQPPTKGFDGQVTLVEFWTYGCWNCRNVEPYVKQWHKDYAPQGLAVIAVHTPEFEREYDVDKVSAYLKQRGITYPVVIDNDFGNWNRYANRYWPALYLIDKRGVLRYTRIGEGGYRETERQIEALLAEPGVR